MHYRSQTRQVPLKSPQFPHLLFSCPLFGIDKLWYMKPNLLKLNLQLSYGKQELVNTAVSFNEILTYDKVDWPVDSEVKRHITPMAVVKGRWLTNHLPLLQIHYVVALVYGRDEAEVCTAHLELYVVGQFNGLNSNLTFLPILSCHLCLENIIGVAKLN